MNIFQSVLTAAVLLASSLAFAGQVNINKADAETLVSLKGVGPAKAAAIVAYRDQFGPFKSIDQLADVKGIGEKTLELNKESLTITSE